MDLASSGNPGKRERSEVRLEVRLLGGFEVRLGGQPVAGFESQKVRALFAYLVVHRRQLLSRDHLAGLLWPERHEEAARQNLRQALYNIRRTFPSSDAAPEIMLSSHRSIQINPELECWLDVEAFEEALRRGLSDGGTDPHQLAVAARHYNGDFMSGFLVKGSTTFEEWLVTEQERLREAAIEALRTLVERYLARGEFRVGIQYARRLVAVDPLSEEAHRYLMKLYALSGRRGRALAQYEDLRGVLDRELGVEPLHETSSLYNSILMQELPSTGGQEEEERPLGPLIPLVGRSGPYTFLNRCWESVLSGQMRLMLLEGETGVGKTRLAKSVIDTVSARHRAMVLKAASVEESPLISYQPFAEILADALSNESPAVERAVSGIRRGLREVLLELIPDPPEGVVERVGKTSSRQDGLGLEEVFDAIRTFLVQLAAAAQPAQAATPVILYLDGLQWADPPSLDLLEKLIGDPPDSPIWIIGSYRPRGLARDHPLRRIRKLAGSSEQIDTLSLDRLDPPALQEVAAALVGDEASGELGDFLFRRGGGLPLAVAELINCLWDDGVLTPRGPNRWSLGELPGGGAGAAEPTDLHQLIRERSHRLATSTRRLLSMAAVIGSRFDAELLRRACDEHPVVVDTGIQILIERWLVRQALPYWAQPMRERDLVLWTSGARRGSFEFAHESIRQAVLSELGAARRRAMHGQVAEALEEVYGDHSERISEQLAYHWGGAARGDRALPYLLTAARRSAHISAHANAVRYCDIALETIEALDPSDAAQAKTLRSQRAEARRLRSASRKLLRG